MKRIVLIVSVICSLTLSSCFELIEQLDFKKDGSGMLQVTLNLSRSKTRLNSIMKMKKVNGRDVPSKEEITTKIRDLEKSIAAIAGISQTKTTIDFTNYIFSLQCRFTQLQQVNTIAKKIREKEKTPAPSGTEQIYVFNPTSKIFSRVNKYLVKKDYENLSNADKEVFASADYTAVYKFEQSIISVTNKDCKIAANKKAVMLKFPILDLINNKKSIENNISFSN